MRVGVDTGGTFTDLVAEVEGGIRVSKVASTPDDPGWAVMEGLRALGLEGLEVVHGTTVATNSLLERRGARVLFVTNDGFEDIAVIGRQDRAGLYDLAPVRAAPLHVAAVGSSGDIGAVAREVRAEAIAICLLDAYRDPGAEEKLAAAVEGLGLPVSISSRVLCEFREFERASTTLADAFVRPVVSRYLRALALRIAPGTLSVMLSGGGVASAERAAASPVGTVLSGPAGGVLGAAAAARRAGAGGAISFDMGGTSTDVAVVAEGLRTSTTGVIGGVPIAIAAVEVLTVGAGGGSIAHLDDGGALAVGPRSAGADPGPACYARGGKDATVTDAHVVLGHLRGLLAGELRLDAAASDRVVASLGEHLGMATRTTAKAILDVADAAMERPIRRLTVERGVDPGGMTLVAFGGAGGLHACRVATSLGIGRVLLPVAPGLLSAIGMLGAPHRAEASRTILRAAHSAVPPEVADVAASLAREAETRLASEGGAASVVISFDMRFLGQSHEIAVTAGDDVLARFREEHARRYGFVLELPVEIVTVRAVAEGTRRPVELPALRTGGPDAASALASRRPTSLSEHTPVYERERLLAGMTIEGPAIIEELSATALVLRGWVAQVLAAGDLMLSRDS